MPSYNANRCPVNFAVLFNNFHTVQNFLDIQIFMVLKIDMSFYCSIFLFRFSNKWHIKNSFHITFLALKKSAIHYIVDFSKRLVILWGSTLFPCKIELTLLFLLVFILFVLV